MKFYKPRLSAKIIPLLIVVLLAAMLPSATAAQSLSVGGIESVSPTSATQGDADLPVTITLKALGAPPSWVNPRSVRIGDLAATAVSRQQLEITAVFDIPADEPTGLQDVSVEFPARRGTITFSTADAFEIVAGEPPPDPPGAESYPIVDTGQAACYDDSQEITCPQAGAAFAGQDAQYAGLQPSYVDNDDGTVSDLNTGLMWQKTPGEKVTYAEAVAGADAFDLAGYDDWRLPTIKELYSLILFSGIDPSGWQGGDPAELTPFIDTDYFDFEYGDENAGERLIDAQYWSSTEYVGAIFNDEAAVFGVNFADGRIKGYPRDAGPGGDPMQQFVRYVRGNPDYGLNSFVDNDDGTVTDVNTGLMWMQADSGVALNWEEALEYCESLDAAGYDDWRLPNAKELQSIVDYTRSPATTGSAAIDPVFSATAISDEGGELNYPFYWTSTTHANWTQDSGRFAAYVAFGEALGWMPPPFPGGDYVLLDVHGAGAQRSDPKLGDPDDWPYGNGPQGDVVRIDNYVRCVRDADSSG